MTLDAPADAAPAGRLRSGRGSAQELLALQRLSWSSLIISATQRCPLNCRHCITRSGPDIEAPVLSPALAQVWAADLPEAAARGLRRISFTGGEPLLAREAVEILSLAAAASDLETYVVTSGAWASSPAVAARMVARFAHITRWDIGYDAFHAEHLAWTRLAWALEALGRQGCAVTVRICDPEDPTRLDQILADLDAVLPRDAEIIVQPTRRLGRADGPDAPAAADLPTRPCVSTGLFLRGDGTTGPCCSGLAYDARGLHPFEYGRVRAPGDLLQAWRTWRADPLLRLLRLSGFAALQGTLTAAGLAPTSTSWPLDPCESCVALWRRTPGAAEALRARIAGPEAEARLDALETALYDDVWAES